MASRSNRKSGARKPEAIKAKAEKRNLISAFFITALISLSYQEMVPPVREAFRASGLSFSVIALPIIFFLVTVRFFIGNYLHLQNEKLMMMSGYIWVYDLIFITLQSVIIIFLAGLTSVKSNLDAYASFSTVLITLYIVDVVWILSQFLFLRSWKRPEVPWQWAALNTAISAAMFLVSYFFGSGYSVTSLSIIVAINVAGFFVDLFLIDRYEAM